MSVLRRLISRFQLPISSNKLAHICDACQLGKNRRLHLPSRPSTSMKPFDLIHSDVWGPSSHLSINGNKYYLSFIDDHSKFVWIYFLSSKDQVFRTVQLFIKLIQTQFSTLIKSFQTDWGGEYRNVSTYLASLGIQHRVSCPYTPAQNGSSEHQNRVIVEKGLALLAHAHLPFQFWEHAFHTSVYLSNRTISPALLFKSPFEILYGKLPDYAFLKSFGCLSYPYLRPYNTTKLNYRSSPCLFLDYSSKHKGYICFHVQTSRIFVSRFVIFDELIFPYPFMASADPPPVATELNHRPPLAALQQAAAIPTIPNAPQPPPPPSHASPPSSPAVIPASPSQSDPALDESVLPSPTSLLHPPSAVPLDSDPPSSESQPLAPTLPPDAPSWFRPPTNSTHPMVIASILTALSPKLF